MTAGLTRAGLLFAILSDKAPGTTNVMPVSSWFLFGRLGATRG
jgi:hypothetical protein